MIDLNEIPRRKIRYIMFCLKDDVPVDGPLVEAIEEYYGNHPDFGGWENFSIKWDIGTDDPIALSNWDDPSRQDKWYTWGINKLKICKNRGLPRVHNKEEGVMREFVNPLPYMVHAGFANPDGRGKYILDIKKLLEEVEERDSWPQVLETEVSLVHSEV